MSLISKEQLLKHWEGHRRLTRRTIEAFPEDKLFTFKIEGMRPFAEMIAEALEWPEPSLMGMLTGEWVYRAKHEHVRSKRELLATWDESLGTLRRYWQDLTVEILLRVETDPWFGSEPRSHLNRILYLIDNEIHHRAQGYVYLRLLGTEPPAFYER